MAGSAGGVRAGGRGGTVKSSTRENPREGAMWRPFFVEVIGDTKRQEDI